MAPEKNSVAVPLMGFSWTDAAAQIKPVAADPLYYTNE